MDSFSCSCGDGITGDFCECNADAGCINVNESISYTLPPNFDDILIEEETTTFVPTPALPDDINRLDPSVPPEIDSSIINPTAFSEIAGAPTSTIVYNMTEEDGLDVSPVTSLYIYEISSSELVTRSFLADDGFIIQTSPTIDDYDSVTPTEASADIINPDVTQEIFIPVTVVTQSTLDTSTIGFDATEGNPYAL